MILSLAEIPRSPVVGEHIDLCVKLMLPEDCADLYFCKSCMGVSPSLSLPLHCHHFKNP